MLPGEEFTDFRSSYGCAPSVVCILWEYLVDTGNLPEGGALEHLMWTLCFMKTYTKAKELSVLCGGADKKTIRKWAWQFIEALSDLESLIVSG